MFLGDFCDMGVFLVSSIQRRASVASAWLGRGTIKEHCVAILSYYFLVRPNTNCMSSLMQA